MATVRGVNVTTARSVMTASAWIEGHERASFTALTGLRRARSYPAGGWSDLPRL